MTLVRKQEPLRMMPVNNPVPIIYASSFAAQDGFRYRIRLIDSGLTNTLLETWIYPDTDYSNYGIYDFSMILSDELSSDVRNWDTLDITRAVNSTYKYNYNITEFIGSTSGETSGGTDAYYVFRGVIQYENTWNIGTYVPWTGSTPATFLSTRQKRYYKLTDYATVNTFHGIYGAYSSIWNRLYVQIGSDVYSYSGDTSMILNPGPTPYGIYSVPIGPAQINTLAIAGEFTNIATSASTNAEILDVNDTYYEVWLNSGTTQRVTEKLRIDLNHKCNRHDGATFLYLGDLSTYEVFTFVNADFKAFNSSRNEVKSNYYRVSSDEYTYLVGDRGRKNTNVRTVESHSANSDWLRDEEAQDLMELFRSPDVYIIRSGEIYPVIITSNSYAEKTIAGNRLFNYTINYEMAYEKFSNT